ncbi:hypothetical protein [Bradyrhizobium sp. URHD0069]|uniref:hypothetical protein n=1 Tax=Bradyrhizobium sp. URHD0069 TaxID=1380355 RepID=UPI000AE63A5F|nr:hypothetical protein [Bradyrhizobium sp. URHD0069]
MGVEIRAARLGVATFSAGCRQNGLIRGDRKQACEFADRDIAARRYFDRKISERVVPGIEERLNCHRRLVVEQDDQLFADVDERDLLVCDRREVDLDFLIVSEIDNDRLIGQGLGQFEYAWRRRIIGISRAGSLSNLKLSVHNLLRRLRPGLNQFPEKLA